LIDSFIYSFVHSFTVVDFGMFSMFGRTGAPTKRGPPQDRDCRTPARHFLTCGVGPIFECRKPCLHAQFR